MKETHVLKKLTKLTFELYQDKALTALVEHIGNLTQICASGTSPRSAP